MSRIGKHKIATPAGVSVVNEGNLLRIKKGTVERVYDVPSRLKVEVFPDGVLLSAQDDEKRTNALWGTSQRNIYNIIKGLDKGFKVDLELVGVGYKAAVQGKKLVLQLGYSHDVEYEIPEGISAACPNPTTISITGSCKQKVGEVAAQIRKYRKPEPYKGKGVIKVGEFVYRKEGKKK